MNDSTSKIQHTHLERRAAVYLRQSTLKQVHEHRESTARQYALQQRAAELGWSPDRIDVIDEDLGHSGSSAQGREGFQCLAEEVARGRVGAIFALEVSRLSRSSADWHRLLDLCGLADVIIADEQCIYTPRDYNDRLLLGLKGTMSEAEQYWMRLRLQGGKLNKARRGELFFNPPSGYEWDEATRRFRFDSDEHVQQAVRLVFERFRFDGSAGAVARYFVREELKMPVRDPATDSVQWVRPTRAITLKMLSSPIYAGAYVYGRREVRAALVDGQLRQRRTRLLSQELWKACLQGHHPAYITWDQFMANQRKLDENRSHRKSPHQRGAAREGSALLQGIALCGRCGHRMSPHYYPDGKRSVLYVCRTQIHHAERGRCWSLAAPPVDAAVARLFLEVVQPPEIELALAVAREVERQASEIDRQWRLRLDRAHYDARLAERRYKAVDPENRVVARTLEREWNDKLRSVDEVEREYEFARQHAAVDLGKTDRARVLALTKDLPHVWNAETTSHAERKNLLRMLVREVTLSPVDLPQRQTRIQILWQTGAVSDFTIPRPRPNTATSTQAMELIRRGVTDNKTDSEISVELNRAELRSGIGRPWTPGAVKAARCKAHIVRVLPGGRAPDRRADGLYSVHGVAAHFGVTDGVVRSWVAKGWLTGRRDGDARAWWFELDNVTVKRVETARTRRYRRSTKTNGTP